MVVVVAVAGAVVVTEVGNVRYKSESLEDQT